MSKEIIYNKNKYPIFILLFITIFSYAENSNNNITEIESINVISPLVIKNVGKDFINEYINIGPLGKIKVLDAPVSIFSISNNLMKKSNATEFYEILKYIPSAQMQARGGFEMGRPQVRGMQSDVVANHYLDDFYIGSTTAYPLELFNRIDVVSSLTGAIYGPAPPSGTFNYITKRPTPYPNNYINLNLNASKHGKIHIDYTNTFGKNNIFSFRINALHDNGKYLSNNSRLKRSLLGLAIDIKLTDKTIVELNGDYYKYQKFGYTSGFGYSPISKLPKPLNPQKKGFSLINNGSDLETITGTAKIKHYFNNNWLFNAGISRQIVDRGGSSLSISLLDEYGNYQASTLISNMSGRFTINSNFLTLKGKFKTGNIEHDMFLGTRGYVWNIFYPKKTESIVLGKSNIYNPTVFEFKRSNYINITKIKGRKHNNTIKQQSYIIGDNIKLNDSFSILASSSYSIFKDISKNNSNKLKKSHGISNMLSIAYKPSSNITTYISYADTIEPGDVSPSENVKNIGEVLTPYRSKQFELGTKYAFNDKLNFSVALFKLNRPFAFTGYEDKIFKVQGKQENIGLELSLIGNLTDNLAIYSGATFLNAKLKNAENPLANNKFMVGEPKIRANILLEYAILSIKGLSINGNINYTGKRAADTENKFWVPHFVTLDLGMQYLTKFINNPLSINLSIKNITNKRYWGALFPSSIDGSINDERSGSAFLGDSRSIDLGLSLKF